MEILAFGVQYDEKPLLEQAFADTVAPLGHELRCLDVNLDADTAALALGHEVVVTPVNAVLDHQVLQTLAVGGTGLIAQRSTGFNNIDLPVAERLGMTVARVVSYSPHSVAEHAWSLALALNRRIARASRRTRDFDFRISGLMGRDLHGRTAGVIGTGKIGAAFARIAHGFGMRLLGWDIAENPECLDLGMTYVPIADLLARADVVTLHVPLTPQTQHLIGADSLRLMKDDAILVNTSRGGLVDTAALVAELRAGRFTGVGLDVYEAEEGLFFLDKSLETVDDDTLARLVTFPNVLVTAHQAYYTSDAVAQISRTTASNVADYLAGRRSENVLVPRPPD
ncbi:2-hydroxyacid dehydrogenase [Streptomyces sp. NPDC002644]